jgi:glycosyltransferase involved in cell wall biosynthesis
MSYRVFTNDIILESTTWQSRTSPLPFLPEDGAGRRELNAVRNALVTARAVSSRDIVVLTDSHNLTASLYGLMHNLKTDRPTLVRTDPLLQLPASRYLARPKIEYLRAAIRGVDRLIVWSPAVIDRYVERFGLPREKMAAQHFHHTLSGYDVSGVKQGDYVFSGGDSMRDYLTLIEAARGLRARVIIATRLKLGQQISIPDNVTVKAVSAAEFRELMAGARLVVFPLRTDSIRTSGQQSYLNAMALGKAVIVTDTIDAPFYIEDGETGALTPSGDGAALREAIASLLDDPERARKLGQAARERALPMDQEFTWSSILQTAIRAHEDRMR